MIFNTTIRTVQGGGSGEDITITGGGNAFMTADGDLFMTEDGAPFSVNGNDRVFDVENFPNTVLENLVYKREETRLDPDYITRTYTQYGIPLTRNVEVFQYNGEEEKPKAWMVDLETGDIYDAAIFCALFGSPKSGYKIVTNMTDCDDSDTETIYLVRSVNIIRLYLNPIKAWHVFKAQEVKSVDSTISGYSIYYGKPSWQSLTEAKAKETDYYKTLQTMNNLIGGSVTEIECNTNGCNSYAFYGQEKLKIAKFLHTGDVTGGTGAIGGAAFGNCKSLICVILHSKYDISCSENAFNGCCHINGTIDETYNPNGLKDGYIYVPLSAIDDYKNWNGWRNVESQIHPLVKDINELYSLDTTKYTIACCGDVEVKYNGTSWVDLR